MYTIDSSTGILTPNMPAAVATGDGPDSIAIDPSGMFAYVSAGGDGVSMYAIDASTGILMANTPATISAGYDRSLWLSSHQGSLST